MGSFRYVFVLFFLFWKHVLKSLHYSIFYNRDTKKIKSLVHTRIIITPLLPSFIKTFNCCYSITEKNRQLLGNTLGFDTLRTGDER